MKINILGYEYDVILHDGKKSATDSLGSHWGKELKLYLNSDQDPIQLKSTLIHEILEAVNYLLDLALPHETITRLEAGIFSALQNSEIFKYELQFNELDKPERPIA